MTAPVVTLLSDFGYGDAYAGIMKGVILGLCPEARLVDLTHAVPPQNVRAGALILRSAVSFFPAGTIHVAVVDPGVGAARAPVLVQTPRAWLIGPDNGLLYPAARQLGIEGVLALTNARFHVPAASRTFHGRDIFSPVAGHLAGGENPAAFGAPHPKLAALELPQPVREGERVCGEVVYVDGFGNLITNIGRGDVPNFPNPELSVSIPGWSSIPVAETYADVGPESPVALITSWDQLEIAVRDGNAAARLGAQAGTPVWVSLG